MKIESYSHGSPCWVCLGTTDTDDARRFYAELFGWEYAEAEMFPGMADSPVVFNASKGGDLAGAIAPHLGKPGSPASWAFNFSVDDVESAVARAGQLGGAVNMGPMDVGELGRVAVVADPNGVETILWQARKFIGAGVMFEHGTFTWAQMVTRHRTTSSSFHGRLLGMEINTMPAPGGGSNDVLLSGEVPMVGIMDMPDEAAEQETPDHWIVYFHVDDVDATVELAAAMGGTAIMAPNQFADIGRIAVVADPQGAVLGLITPGDGPQP